MWRRILPFTILLAACDLPGDVTDERAQPVTAPNLAQNPSLETDANADQVPDCWQRGGYGTNSATFTLTSNAYDGSVAQRIDVTSFSSGARRIVTKQDTGACAPAATPGHTYNVTAHYLSNTRPIFTIYYRNSSGSWVWFAESPSLPTSSSYALASYTTPALPSGATAISVGLSIVALGSITMDAFSLTDTAGGGADTTPPTVQVVSPSSGSTVTGTVEISALASDTVGVARVEFYVNGTLLSTDATAPYKAEWDTPSYAGTNATLTARAYDTSGNAATSAPVTVTVGTTSDTTPPTISFVSPADGATVAGDVQVRADVTDAGGVDRVELWLNGQFMGDVRNPPYISSWNSQPFVGQTVTLFIRAYDKTENLKQSETHTVTVAAKSDFTAPTVVLTSPADGATVSGTITLSANASDNVSVARVDFFADGPQFTEGSQLIATELDPPYSASWDSSVYAGQTFTVTARAVDTQGNTTLSAAHTITVAGGTDTTRPTVELTSPAQGATVSGTITLSANAADASGINRVEFLLSDEVTDGAILGTDTTAPYSMSFDTTPYAGRKVEISARAWDNSDNRNDSEYHSITVAGTGGGDSTPPTVALTSPANGANVSGTITVSANATDAGGINRVDFYANGTPIATEQFAPYEFQWDTTPFAGQTVTLDVVAYDNSNNNTTAASRTITVGAAATNLLQNPSLEVDANGDQTPDCWKRDYYGTNTRTFTLTNDAFDGSRAMRVDITSFTSGGARLASAQDTGACAPAATPGRTYTMTANYKSNVQPKFSVYYRNSSGSWVWLAESSSLPVSSSYRKATYTTPPLPAGATRISIGLSIFSAGSLTTDAYTLVSN